ncbi:MAG TPA: glycine C-acetyltransferase [Candidatus Acidoferrales bacterium]|nr:glycine C-acetyltransferase [Candidatus Acidoferrales bacterium]
MYGKYQQYLLEQLESIRSSGLYKEERVIASPQGAIIKLQNGKEVLNFCANNYLGLSSHPKVVEAAKRGLDERGYGMSSVRFICGTQDIHKILEQKISRFLKTEDTILYAACFDANGGVFEPLLGEEDTIISDELNHASIIDGIRSCKAMRYRYRHADLDDLEEKLKASQGARFKMIATDGVFSMDGEVAQLDKICELGEKYEALVMVDDSHATGFVGKNGRGSIEAKNVMARVDIITGTLGKAAGGASGGFTSGKKEIVEFLRQRSRPYLFSNTLPPPIVYAEIAVFDLLESTTELRDKLAKNTGYFRSEMTKCGFDIKPGDHPIVPIMLYDAKLAVEFANDLLNEGIYVIGFSFPVVPKGQARIRVQISAAHEKEHLDKAVAAFERIGKKLRVLRN